MPTPTHRPRKAARQARAAEYWGDRRKAAEQEGPEAAFAVAVDHLRSTIHRIPQDRRPLVYAEAARALDAVRQSLADT